MSNYPTVRPSLTLDFQKSKQLDPRIAFSRSSTATYVEGGVVKYADEHQARFEKEGLLIEESRTNAILYSTAPDAEFNQDSSNFTYTFNQPAPDGSNDAYLMENVSNTSTNRGGQFSNYATIPTTGKITVSVFVKPIGGQVIALGGDNGNQGYYGVPLVKYDFTVSPPVPSNTSNNGQHGFTAEPFIQEIGNGWYRLIEVIDLTNGTGFLNGQTRGPRVCNITPGTSTVVWGYQIETGSSHTSYIPTSGSTSTRALDIARITGDNFSSWFNKSEGTMLVSMSDGVRSDLGANLYGSHSGDRIIMLTSSNWRFRYQTTGRYSPGWTNTNIYSANDVRTAGPMKYAYAYKPYDYALSVKGSTLTHTQRDPQPNVITLKLGEESSFGGNNGSRPNAAISRIAYYPERLTNAQLEAITS